MNKVLVVGTCFFLLTACSQSDPPSEVTEATAEPSVATSSKSNAVDDVRAVREVAVLDRPSGKRIVNPIASRAIGHNEYFSIDPTAHIKETLYHSGWIKIADTDLDFTGWVRSKDLEHVPVSKSGSRVYDMKDINFMDDEWSSSEKRFKALLLQRFNKLSQECAKLEPIIMAASESTPQSPKFNFTCDDGHAHFIPYQPVGHE